jgi:hypothetical protein
MITRLWFSRNSTCSPPFWHAEYCSWFHCFSKNDKDRMTKCVLFFFDLILGMIYITIISASIELKLFRLADCSTSFVFRVSVINNIAVQAVITSMFQLKTTLDDSFVEIKNRPIELILRVYTLESAQQPSVFFK